MQEGTRTASKPLSATPQRRHWLVAPVLIFAGLVVLFALALQKGDPSKIPSALVGRPAPPLNLAPLENLVGAGGQPIPGIDTEMLKSGKVSVVNFWASWCAPCVEEHPMLLRLAQRSDVVLHGVNYKDQAANARRFLGRYGNPFRTVGVDTNGRAAIDWGVTGMPETFVVAGDGVIVYKHIGPITPRALERNIIPAIEAAVKLR